MSGLSTLTCWNYNETESNEDVMLTLINLQANNEWEKKMREPNETPFTPGIKI